MNNTEPVRIKVDTSIRDSFSLAADSWNWPIDSGEVQKDGFLRTKQSF